jgi:hypothetical protein
VEKAIHGPCPRMRAKGSPLGRHPKKPTFLGVANRRILRRQAFSTACELSVDSAFDACTGSFFKHQLMN